MVPAPSKPTPCLQRTRRSLLAPQPGPIGPHLHRLVGPAHGQHRVSSGFLIVSCDWYNTDEPQVTRPSTILHGACSSAHAIHWMMKARAQKNRLTLTCKKGISSSLVRCGPNARAMVDSLRIDVNRRTTSSDFSSSMSRWIG